MNAYRTYVGLRPLVAPIFMVSALLGSSLVMDAYVVQYQASAPVLGGLSTHPALVLVTLLLLYLLLQGRNTAASTQCSLHPTVVARSMAVVWVSVYILAIVALHASFASRFLFILVPMVRMLLWSGVAVVLGMVLLPPRDARRWSIAWAMLLASFVLLGLLQPLALPHMRAWIVHSVGWFFPGLSMYPAIGIIEAASVAIRIDGSCLGFNLFFLSLALVAHVGLVARRLPAWWYIATVLLGSVLCNLVRIWLVAAAATILRGDAVALVHTVVGMLLSFTFLSVAWMLRPKSLSSLQQITCA